MVDSVTHRSGRAIVSKLGLAALLIAAAAAGCDRPSANATASTPASGSSGSSAAMPPRPVVPQTEVLAKVNNAVISKKDLEMVVRQLKEALGDNWKRLPAQQSEGDDLHDLLDSLIEAELRAQDLSASGLLNRDAELQQRFLSVYRNYMAQEWVATKVDQLAVSEAEVQQFYDENKDRIIEPERIKVREIVVASEEAAKSALVRLLSNEDFVTVAQQVSTRVGLAAGPEADRWVLHNVEKDPNDPATRGFADAKLEQAAFGIEKVAGVSNYVKGNIDGQYHIFQLTQRQPQRARPLAEVRDQIEGLLRVQKLTQMTEALKSRAKIELNAERLDSIEQ